MILFGIRNILEIVPDIAQSTHGIRNIFADIRNVSTRPHMVLGMFLLAFPVPSILFRLTSYSNTVNKKSCSLSSLIKMSLLDIIINNKLELRICSFSDINKTYNCEFYNL